MESFHDVGPVPKCWDGFPGDLESFAYFLDELVSEGVRIIAFNAAWKSKVREDAVGESADNGGRCHVLCSDEPYEFAEGITYRQDVSVSIRFWMQRPKEIQIEHLHWFAHSGDVDDVFLGSQMMTD